MFLKRKDSKIFIFESENDKIDEVYAPVPSSKIIPDWYKEMDSYYGPDKKGTPVIGDDIFSNATIKKCLPVFDSMTSGYMFVLQQDLWVQQVNNAPYYTWNSTFNPLGFHNTIQAPTHPQGDGFPVAKIINPWIVKTPKGFSTMFIPPLHRDNMIQILPGLVDTDLYPTNVNFPFTLKDPKFEGLIPAGTPYAQLIPIKRENWSRSINKHPEIKYENVKAIYNLRNVFYHFYKTRFWQKKSYR